MQNSFAVSSTGSGEPARVKVLTGFMPRSSVFHRIYNGLFGGLLLVTALPLLVAISIALFVTQGPKIFYRGARIGQNGRIFHILKFRTLDAGKAAALTRDTVLPVDSGAETPLGGFLRDSRLDELPQLFNILMGDMNICGPRPVRPEMAEIERRRIPGYDMRFRAKPGLVGHTQAYMNHGTSKRIRARYNSILCRAPVRYLNEIALVFLVGACVLGKAMVKLATSVENRVRPGVAAARRERRRARKLGLALVMEGGKAYPVVRVSRDFAWLSPSVALPDRFEATLRMTLARGRMRRAVGNFERCGPGVYRYAPASPFAFHVISRYVWQAVVVPHDVWIAGLFTWRRDRTRREAAVVPLFSNKPAE